RHRVARDARAFPTRRSSDLKSAGNRTHEGGPARHVSPELQLRRSVLACMLWEDQFYEDGVAIAGRIRELVSKSPAEQVASLAVRSEEHTSELQSPCNLVCRL